jgi:hypothetical protein
MPKSPPPFRFLTKPEGADKLEELGEAWKTSKADIFSVSIDRATLQAMLDVDANSEKIRFMMVTNRPKQKPASAPDRRPAA